MTEVNNSADNLERQLEISERLLQKLADLAYSEDQDDLQVVELHEGQVLFEQGDEAQDLYILRAGMLGVRVTHADGGVTNIARMAPGAIVGEMALLSGSKRSATVFAINDAGLIRITQEQFEQLMLEDETALAEMRETAVPRWQRQQLVRALRRLLGDIDAQTLDALLNAMTWHYVANGEVVFHQGDPSDGMYLLVNGRLRTTRETEEGIEDLGLIGPGEPVGEMGVLTAEPRTATIYAVRESNLVKLKAVNFKKLARQYPDLMINIARIIVERQQRLFSGTASQPESGLNLVVLPVSVQVDALKFGQDLGLALERHGKTLVLDGPLFDAMYGEDLASQMEIDDIGSTAVVAFMNELDLKTPFIVYIADPFASAWTRRCLGHADRVLILADPAADLQPGAAERLLDDIEVPLRRQLVFWGRFKSENLPDVSAWTAARPDTDANFVNRGNSDQVQALVEQLTTST